MIVIADSSALVALSVCDVLHLLEPLFGHVRVPQAVFDEVSIANKPQAKVLQEFLAEATNLKRDSYDWQSFKDYQSWLVAETCQVLKTWQVCPALSW